MSALYDLGPVDIAHITDLSDTQVPYSRVFFRDLPQLQRYGLNDSRYGVTYPVCASVRATFD